MNLSRWSLSQMVAWIGSTALTVLVVPMGIYVAHEVRSSAEHSLVEHGQILTRDIARQIVTPMLMQDRLTVHEAIESPASSDWEVSYICVADARGRVYAHTFTEGFPFNLPDIWRNSHDSIVSYRTRTGPIMDVSAPILDGQLGTVHAGMDRVRAMAAQRRAKWLMATVFAGALLLVFGGAWLIAAKVSRPLTELEADVARFPEGVDGGAIAAKTGTREVESLSRGFVEMSKRLMSSERQRDETQVQIEASREELERANLKIHDLIEAAAGEQSFEAHYENPNLPTCWRVRKCGNVDCPCYGREAMRCWQAEGTLCDRGRKGSFSEKVTGCRLCEVFRQACPDRLTELAEGFDNMMYMLSRKALGLEHVRYHAVQQERMAVVGQMAAGIAHEIGNPLSSLFSLVQILKSSANDEKTAERLGMMQLSIQRISQTVREFVDFGRPAGGEDWTYTSIEKIVRDTLGLLTYHRRARNVEIAITFDPDLPETRVIEYQLQQVFMNIALNGLDAMQGAGTLKVDGHRSNGAIEVAITDTGEGIASDQLQHIFEPFYTTKLTQRGTGLGLAMTYNAVQKHGGTIRVESEKGKGTTFVVSIPIRGANGDPHATS